MILREILETLERIERALGGGSAPREEARAGKGADEWLQTAIDSILSYQAGEKADKS